MKKKELCYVSKTTFPQDETPKTYSPLKGWLLR